MPKGFPGSRAPHGTPARYAGHGCRCDECRAAWSAYRLPYRREKLGQKPLAEHVAEIEPGHGTESRYTHHGCRCDACKRAATTAKFMRRTRDPLAYAEANRRDAEKRRARAKGEA